VKAKKILMRVVALILVLLMLLPLALRAFASGDVNVDAGGGNLEEVTGQCFWTPGNDGVRVSVYK